jgi:hypothetical protein
MANIDEILSEEIDQLETTYELLMNKPQPEQEEEAQKDLVVLFEKMLSKVGEIPEHSSKIKELHDIVKKWDTLDQWFSEVEGLADKMRAYLSQFLIVKEPKSPAPIANGSAETKSNGEVDAYQKRMDDLEEKMHLLEEREKNLQEKEAALQKKENASAVKPVKATNSGLKSKLLAPKLKIPLVKTPKKIIRPSTVAATPKPAKIETPQIKIKIGSNMSPIKIQPTPIKIDIPPSGTGSSSFQPKIKLGGGGGPKIRPVGGGGPKIRPVGQASIRPVGTGGPKIRPVGQASIRPAGQPSMKPVGMGGPKIRPVGQPSIKPVGGNSMKPINIKRPNISPVGMNIAPSGGNKSNKPATPVNLFNQSVGKTPVNLFEPKKKSTAKKSTGAVPVSADNQTGGPISKIGGLNKIDFAAQAPIISKEENELAQLSTSELYQSLIKLEAQRYYYDKQIKNAEESFAKGKLIEGEFRGIRERNNFELENIGIKIKNIRSMVLGN